MGELIKSWVNFSVRILFAITEEILAITGDPARPLPRSGQNLSSYDETDDD
jgi:hypothetical protein